ncbi:MAG: hypothetical protein IKC74_02780, partial [Clostridia bacterium]|nr:hypothetical protein [Clostridia bacterium]
MKIKKRLMPMIITLIAICSAIVCLSIATIRANAIPATAVTLTATDGSQTILTTAVDTGTYSWDPETATLTLNGYSGRTITTTGDINLHLVGTNTLTLDNTLMYYTAYGINLNYNSVRISADDGGVLNINGSGLKTIFSAISGSVIMENGTLNIDIDTTSSGWLYGFERSVSFDPDCTKKAEINVDIERDQNAAGVMYGFYNGASINNRSNVEINVELRGGSTDYIYTFSDLYVYNSSPVIVATADNNDGDINKRLAVYNLMSLSLTEGGYVELNGKVRMSSIGGSTSPHTVTTTPADNKYMWIEYDNIPGSSGDFVLSSLDGQICENVVFEYADEEEDLEWVGGSHFNIPADKVDGRCSINILAGVRGLSTYDAYYLKAEIIDGQLPEGITLSYSGGNISGTFASPCDAGSVTIRLTDKNNTPSDPEDDRITTFTISYGAVSEKDRFLTVGNDDPVEMKENGSGTGWSYDASTKTLTLNNYNSGPIFTEDLLNIHLIGTNTITLTDENNVGIKSTFPSGTVNLSADDGGILNINTPANYTKSFIGINAALYFNYGTVNMNLSSDFSGDSSYTGIGIKGMVRFTDNQTKLASWNVTIKNNAADVNVNLSGNHNNTFYIQNRDNVEVNIDIRGDEHTEIKGIYSLYVYNSSPDITVYTSNNGGQSPCDAVNQISCLRLTNGGRLELTGRIITSNIPYMNPHTVTRTPADNKYLWRDTDPHYYYKSLVMSDTDNEFLNYAVFEYSEIPAALEWLGGEHFDIPAGSVGDYLGLNLWSGIRGGNYFSSTGPNDWTFEIIEGQLPPGLDFDMTYYGDLTAQINKPCVAGTAKIRAIDRGGNSDPADDRYIEFEISYGAFITDIPVTGLELDKNNVIMDYDGSSQITATVTPPTAAYPNVDVMLPAGSPLYASIGDPVDGVSIITLTSNRIPGKHTVTVKTVELGLTKELTVYIREMTPNIRIDFIEERITGLLVGTTYRIGGEGISTVEFTAENTYYDIPDSWMGKTVKIVRLSDIDENCHSNEFQLVIPNRPNAPTGLDKTDASSFGENDGAIIGVTTDMEYKKSDGVWKNAYDDTVTGLEIGAYSVRYKSTYEAFASKTAPVSIGFNEFNFVDSDEYDIYAGDTDTTISVIDIKNAVSGGKKPYTYSISGPNWLSIDSNGMIRGTRPASAQAATTATITVTDSDSTSLSIIINVGEVTVAHVHDYSDIWKHNETYHWNECICGDKKNLDAHSPRDDDGNCTTAITCEICDRITTEAKAAHVPNDDDGDCTTAVICKNCTTVTTEAKTAHAPNDDDGDCTTAITCKNCTTVTTEAKTAHAPNDDDGDCTTAITCKNCTTVTTEAKTAHVPNDDDGD